MHGKPHSAAGSPVRSSVPVPISRHTSPRALRPAHLVRRGRASPVGVLVVDDHPAVRSELERLLGEADDLAPISAAATAPQAIGIARRLRPLVAVVDYRLPGPDGIALTFELKRLRDPPGVVIHSAFAGTRLALAAIVAGADGIVEKGTGADRLRTDVSAVAAGSRVMPALSERALAGAMPAAEPEDALIAAMLNGGASPAAVSRRLGIAPEWLALRRWAIARRLLGGQRGSSATRGAAE